MTSSSEVYCSAIRLMNISSFHLTGASCLELCCSWDRWSSRLGCLIFCWMHANRRTLSLLWNRKMLDFFLLGEIRWCCAHLRGWVRGEIAGDLSLICLFCLVIFGLGRILVCRDLSRFGHYKHHSQRYSLGCHLGLGLRFAGSNVSNFDIDQTFFDSYIFVICTLSGILALPRIFFHGSNSRGRWPKVEMCFHFWAKRSPLTIWNSIFSFQPFDSFFDYLATFGSIAISSRAEQIIQRNFLNQLDYSFLGSEVIFDGPLGRIYHL